MNLLSPIQLLQQYQLSKKKFIYIADNRYEVRVFSYPAIDREFKTTDYLMLLDCHKLKDEIEQMLK